MNLFARFKLMHRFMIVIVIFAAGFFVYGGWSFKTLNELKVNGPLYAQIVQGKDLIADVLPPPEYILESYLVVFQMRSSTAPDEQARLAERLGVLKQEYETRHDFWKSQTLSPNQADLLLVKSYEPAKAFYHIAQSEFIPALQKGDAAAADTAMGRMKDAYSSHRSAIDEVVKVTTARNEAGEEKAAERIRSGTATMLVILAFSLAVGVLIAVLIIRSLLRQLGGEPDHAAEVARSIASGNLTLPIKVRAGDDTSVIAAMRTMQDMLSRTVAEIKTSVESVTTASSQIASGNMDLSSRTEQQASALEETASSMEELTSTVKQNADNARQANQLAVSASGVAVKGGDVVAQVVTTMGSINDSARKIVDIIGVIDGIAFQTNILALNAAVEAARAGEQGRGFAVVASEVRNLAQRSAAAAKEIKTLISDSVEKVDAGSKLVGVAGSTMEEIVESVKHVTDIMAEIMAASQEQSSGIEQVGQAIGQMDQVTQQNAALVEEAAAAAESLQDQAASLAQVVNIFQTQPITPAH